MGRLNALLSYGLIVIILVGGWSFFLAPAWADLRYRAAFADFVRDKQNLEDLPSPEWQRLVLGTNATRADAVEAAARHMDACDQVGSLSLAMKKDVERLDIRGEALRGSPKRELSRQLVGVAAGYADATQISLEDFCDSALDAVVVVLSPKPGDDVAGLRLAASQILIAERKRADEHAGQIQTIWRGLDAVLFRGFR